MEPEDENELISSLISEISAVKGEQIDLEHYYAKSCSGDSFRRIYRGYEEQLQRAHKIDFDDMLVMCWDLFRKRPDILSAWQKSTNIFWWTSSKISTGFSTRLCGC